MSQMPDNVESLVILHYPDPRLREVARPLADPADPGLPALVERMKQLMHQAAGVGLAATQLGVPVRVFLANPTREPGKEMVLVNPEVLLCEGWQETREGCLSVPDVTLKLRRRQRVLVRYQDLAGQTRQHDATGYLASIFQHESDHLEGRLIIDRAGLVGRLAIRDTLKRLEENANAASGSR